MRAAVIVLLGLIALATAGCGTSDATPGVTTTAPTPGDAHPLAPIQNHGGPPFTAQLDIRLVSASEGSAPCGQVADDLSGDRPTAANCAAYERFACPHANPVLQPVDRILACAPDNAKYLLGRLLLSSQQIATAAAAPGPNPPSWGVYVTLKPSAAAVFARALAQIGGNDHQFFAIVVQGTVVSTSTSHAPMTDGKLLLAATFTENDAKRIAASLGPHP